MIKKEFSFQSVSALSDIHAASYLPDDGQIRAVVQIAHGMAEHLERYEPFAEALCKKGIAVYINDHLGHGKSVSSASELGYFGEKDGWKVFVEDCHRLTEMIKAEHPSVPLVFFGHSMGSFVARAYCFKYASDLKAAVFCGTAGPNPAAGAGIAITKLIAAVKGGHYRSKLIDKIGFGSYNSKFEGRTAFDWLSRDKEQVDKYIADELCGFLFTARGYGDLFGVLSYVSADEWFKGLSKELPVLLISGSMDPVGDYGKGVQKVYDNLLAAGKDKAEIILYPDARHEILNESACFDTVCADVTAFIEENIS